MRLGEKTGMGRALGMPKGICGWDLFLGRIVTCSLKTRRRQGCMPLPPPMWWQRCREKEHVVGLWPKVDMRSKNKHDWLMIGCWKVRHGTLWNKIPYLSTQFWVANRQPSWPFKTSRQMSWWRWQPHESMNQNSLKGSRILIAYLKWKKKMWDLHLSLVNSLARLWVPWGRVFFPKQVYLWGSLLEKNRLDTLLGALGLVGRGFGPAGRAGLGWAWGLAVLGALAGLGVVLGVLWAWGLAVLGALAGLGVGFGRAGVGRAGRAGWVGRGVGRGVWPCWARWLGVLAGLGVVLGAGFGRAGRASWVGHGFKVKSILWKYKSRLSKYKSILSKYKNTLSNYTKYIYKYANIL